MAKKKTKKTRKKPEPEAPIKIHARELVDYVLDCVAENGRIEGTRKEGKTVKFNSLTFDQKTGQLGSHYEAIVETVEKILGWGGYDPDKARALSDSARKKRQAAS